MVFDANASGQWVVTITTPVGEHVTLDMQKLLTVYCVCIENTSYPIAAYWTPNAAAMAIVELCKDSANIRKETKFMIRELSLETLAQLVRSKTARAEMRSLGTTVAHSDMGDYILIANVSNGMLYKFPKREQIPDGYIEIVCDELKYHGNLIVNLWTLPIYREEKYVSETD